MTSSNERVLRLLHEARHALEEERKRRSEPIAIIGMGCRFPGGASSPELFWQSLLRGFDATGDVPRERWDAEALYDPEPSAPGKAYVKRGAFLTDISGFEPEFFGISPREAAGLDPQQRLLLEVCWEALENAGVPPNSLSGSATGVWLGMSLDDYARRNGSAFELERIDPYSALGNARSVAAGRIAYVLGLHGPVMQLDTSCSSSLVAIHLACQSLRSRECDLALVGGVNLMISPEATVALCKLQALAPDGRCKTFDARADGYGRGEGCGVVVLKRAHDAQAAFDHVYAEIRGSALNHDGRSNGLTAPNGSAQEAVLKSALANASLEPNQVQYVEAHGTGTPLGDPIEVLALSRVFGANRPTPSPLYLGSVKTNIGHLEGAAGIAALIKTALCLSHGKLVPHLHVREPNPKVPWQSLPLRIGTETQAWPAEGSLRVAGVSSFGISGTNAHVLLSQSPVPDLRVPAAARSAEVVVLSARTDAALAASAARLAAHLSVHAAPTLTEVAFSLATTRSGLERRVALAASSREELASALDAVARGDLPPGATRGRSGPGPGGVVWLFPGQGAQQVGMGKSLHQELPAFRTGLDEAFAEIDRHLERPLSEVMWAAPGSALAELLHQTSYTQPALFALGWALARWWRSVGVAPDWVGGHSIGEITAACVAGVFSLHDAARLVCARGRLMQSLPHDGGMFAVVMDIDMARRIIEPHRDRVSIAAVNTPSSLVLSGHRSALQEIADELGRRGVQTKALTVSHAFHSPSVEPILEAFAGVAGSMNYSPAKTPIVSNLSGGFAGHEIETAAYWVRHVREPVNFAAGVATLAAAGAKSFFELGPKAVLLPLVAQSLSDSEPLLFASGRAGQGELRSLFESLGAWWTERGRVDWGGVFPPETTRVALPSYPWQRKKYWLQARSPKAASPSSFLGIRLASVSADALFESVWSQDQPAWLLDHRVGGQVLIPAAALVELARAAAQQCSGDPNVCVRDLVLERAVLVREDQGRRLQVVVTGGGTRLTIHSQPAHDPMAPWLLHASAELVAGPASEPRVDVHALRDRCPAERDVPELYRALAVLGLEYGPAFRALRRMWIGGGEALGELRLLDGVSATAYGLHPALLDAALQLAAGTGLPPHGSTFLPVELEGYVLYRRGATAALAHIELREPWTEESASLALKLLDSDGEVIASVDRVTFRRVELDAVTGRSGYEADGLYRLEWPRVDAPPAPALSGRWLLVAVAGGPDPAPLAEALARRGAECEVVSPQQLEHGLLAQHVVCLWDADSPIQAAMDVAGEALSILQSLARKRDGARLWWLTRRALSAATGDTVRPVLATLWGLGRTLMQEHPELACRLIDVDESVDLGEVLARESAALDREDQIAWRGPQRHVARLVRLAASRAAQPRGLRTEGTVFITGGLGALGLTTARSFARRGVKHLLLASRSAPESAAATSALEELRALGARVSVVAVDASDSEALRAVLSQLPPEYPLRGVVHAAGVLDDGVLIEQDALRLSRVMAPKVLGAWNLHLLTAAADLDCFVLFSSIAGTLGSSGQGGYAAANSYLDALAIYRHAAGLPAQSLAFGPWNAGMATRLGTAQRDRLIRQGIEFLEPAAGIMLLERALERAEPDLVVARFRPSAIDAAFDGAPPALWRALLQRTPRMEQKTEPLSWQAQLSTLDSRTERSQALEELLRSEVARVLSMQSSADVSLHRALGDMGVDSLMTLELRRSVSRRLGKVLSAASISSQSTLEALAQGLYEDHFGTAGAAAEPGAVASLGRLHPLVAPKARLFCFHYAGGSADTFGTFAELEAHGIEVHTVSHRRAEPASVLVAERYLKDAVAYIRPRSDAPYALFGHSLGGLMAWRVVEELNAAEVALPSLFVPSAAAFPADLAGDFSPQALAVAFRRILAERADTSQELLDDFIADVLLWRAFPTRRSGALSVPIAAFVGESDHIASIPEMEAWANQTTQGFSLSVLAGDHFYLGEAVPRQAMFVKVLHQLLGT